MNLRYKIKTVVTTSGERLPILLGQDGLPIFEPTVFSLTEVRSRNRASNTIDSYLRSVMVFMLFLDLREIDLDERLNAGKLLSLGEVEELVRMCRLPLEKIYSMLDEARILFRQSEPTVASLEKLRMKSSRHVDVEIDPNSAATRLRNIRDYIRWLALARMSKHSIDATHRMALESSTQNITRAIDVRLPSGSFNASGNDQREGLEPHVVERILEVTKPQSPDNPWKDEHSQHRNALIIEWLLSFGLRRGELLNIRIGDINFRESTVTVTRRADDPGDPRRNQPKVKTSGREIPISAGLLDKTNEYIMNHRSTIRGARKHGFLFVSSDDGAPLSIPSVNKVFNVLRSKCPELPDNVFPHILRHTWNDRFSEEMDANKVGEDAEKKARSYLMGWSETSGTAATYTRRHIRKKAQEASLAMQENMFSKKGNNG